MPRSSATQESCTIPRLQGGLAFESFSYGNQKKRTILISVLNCAALGYRGIAKDLSFVIVFPPSYLIKTVSVGSLLVESQESTNRNLCGQTAGSKN